MGIDSVFRSIAGADWKSSDGDGLSAAEFGVFLNDKAGADGKFNGSEFSATAKSLGLSGEESKAIFQAFGKDGQISVDKFRDLLEKYAGSDKAFNLDELKGGLDKLAARAERKNGEDGAPPAADFGRDAGADKAMDESEFKALCKKAGIDEDTAEKAFKKAAGADGEISRDEFEKAFGGSEAGESKFKSKVKELAGDKEPFAKFGRDAGADGKMDKSEFKVLAKKAGVSENDADKAFDRIAGADGKISREEFKADDGLGGVEVSDDTFRSKVEAASSAG